MTHRPSRRRILHYLAVAALAPLGLTGIAWTSVPGLRRAVVGALTGDAAGAEAIGRRYLAAHPEEGDRALLARRLFEGAAPPTSAADLEVARRRLAERARRDFAAGDTVILDGWIVARTEGRLCALSVITA